MDKNNLFRAYAFDIDDNIRRLPTKIILRKKDNSIVEISTEEYSEIRLDPVKYGYKEIDYDEAMVNFRKIGDKRFIEEILDSQPAPSWIDFVECVNNASIFAWITARGHSVEAFKKAFKKMVISNFDGLDFKELVKNQRSYMDFLKIKNSDMNDEDVLDFYIDICKFYGMTNEDCCMEVLGVTECHEPGIFKPVAFEIFCDYVSFEFEKTMKKLIVKDPEFAKKASMHIGISDDDKKTVDVLMTSIFNKEKKNEKLKIHIYNTSNGESKLNVY